jgi:hypothetical protein
MKNFIRKTRLVLACIKVLDGFIRLVIALVDMASNYSLLYGTEVARPIRIEARALGFRSNA